MTPFDFDCLIHKKAKVAAAEGHFVTTAFGKVRCIDAGAKHLPILVMVPDGPCFLEHFAELIALAQKDFRVIVFDMPGFGHSFPRNGYDHSFDSAAQVIDKVLIARGVEKQKVLLAFSCANGFYALRFAKVFPNRVSHLFLIQTPAFAAMGSWVDRSIPKPLKIPFIGQILAYAQRFKIPPTWFRAALPKHSQLVAEYTQKSVSAIKTGACNCLASVVQGLAKMSQEDLAGVSVPTTLIWGAKDYSHRMTDPHTIKQMVPHAEVMIENDLGHFANLEDPAKFLALVRSKIG